MAPWSSTSPPNSVATLCRQICADLRSRQHKQKSTTTEYREREDGSIAETRILTDKFVPVIRAWDLTPDSATLGRIVTIH